MAWALTSRFQAKGNGAKCQRVPVDAVTMPMIRYRAGTVVTNLMTTGLSEAVIVRDFMGCHVRHIVIRTSPFAQGQRVQCQLPTASRKTPTFRVSPGGAHAGLRMSHAKRRRASAAE